jgi:hypothetical protein
MLHQLNLAVSTGVHDAPVETRSFDALELMRYRASRTVRCPGKNVLVPNDVFAGEIVELKLAVGKGGKCDQRKTPSPTK